MQDTVLPSSSPFGRETAGPHTPTTLPQSRPTPFSRYAPSPATQTGLSSPIFPTPFIRSLHPAASEVFPGSSIGGGSSVGAPTSTTESKSHVPSLTSRAFLSPMSSQRLQAHRGQRPWSMQDRSSPLPEDFDDMQSQSNTNRNSTGSAITIKGGRALPTQADVEALRAISRASSRTDYTEADRMYQQEFLTSVMGHNLPNQQQQEEDDRGMPSEEVEDTPHDYLETKLEADDYAQHTTTITTNGHQHRHSQSTGEMARDEKLVMQNGASRKGLGRNYEYSTGNTFYMLGGRLQNARDKPIVLATGTIILIPSLLFLIFS